MPPAPALATQVFPEQQARRSVTCGEAGTGGAAGAWAAADGHRVTEAGESDPPSEFCMLSSKERWREVEWSRVAITKPQEATSDTHKIGEWLLPTVFKIQMCKEDRETGAQLLLEREGVGQEMFFPI